MNEKGTFYDLFAGIGGFRLGLERANFRCVGSCEIDKHARTIYQKHFGDTPELDACKLDARNLPDFDILAGGFPCQAFSLAGKRLGFEDTRGTLFFEIARIARQKRPKILFLENVKGLLSHDYGRTFGTILATMDELGYDAEWQVVNGRYFLPQNRERVFIIGHLRGQTSKQVFPLREAESLDNKGIERQKEQVVNCIDANYGKGADKHGQRTMVAALRGRGLESPKEIANSVTTNYRSHNMVFEPIPLTVARNEEGKQIRREMQKQGKDWCPRQAKDIVPRPDGIVGCITASENKERLIAVPILEPDFQTKSCNGRRIKDDGDPMYCLSATANHGIFDGMTIRKLTPLECERLQGFPDGWTEGIPESRRYHCIGNAVMPPVIEYIASHF